MHDRRYDVSRVLDVLPGLPSSDQSSDKQHPEDGPNTKVSSEDAATERTGTHNKGSGTTILNVIVGTNPPGTAKWPFLDNEIGNQTLEVEDLDKALAYLKSQDLASYLGFVGSDSETLTGRCPFHDDHQASAEISHNSGIYFLHCYADGCQFKGTVIEVALEALRRCSGIGTTTRWDAIAHLMKQYKLRILGQWHRQQSSLLDQNIERLNQMAVPGSEYPSAQRLIGRIISDLARMYEVAKGHLISDKFVSHGRPVFFASLRWLERKRKGKDACQCHGGHSLRIDRFCMLGLLRKLSDPEVPADMADRAFDVRMDKRQRNRQRFYTIPVYTDALLAEAERRATMFYEAKASVKDISREFILSLYGKELAQEVYPTVAEQGLNESQRRFGECVEAVLLGHIEDDGYTTKRRLLDDVLANYDWASVSARRIGRCLPRLMARHDLLAVYSTKLLKQRFGIDGYGYPRIIIPRESDCRNERLGGQARMEEVGGDEAGRGASA